MFDNKIAQSLITLPNELVYCILNSLDQLTVLLLRRNVRTQLNVIADTYDRYQVHFTFILKLDFR